MVRRIRHCTTCSKRFINSHHTLSECSDCQSFVRGTDLINDQQEKNHPSTRRVKSKIEECNPQSQQCLSSESMLAIKTPRKHVIDLCRRVQCGRNTDKVDHVNENCDDYDESLLNLLKRVNPTAPNHITDITTTGQPSCDYSANEESISKIDTCTTDLRGQQNGDIKPLPFNGQEIDTSLAIDASKMIDGVESFSDSRVCLICGISLVGRKHRLDHIKRCSKKHGITARDVCLNDDEELFTNEMDVQQHPEHLPATGTMSVNPYLRKKYDWHGSTAQDNLTAECKKVPTINQVLMAGARKKAHIEQTQKKQKIAGGNNKRVSDNRTFHSKKKHYSTCPKYKKISGTDFVVDGFHYANPALTGNYFLTHFHSDHYSGITKSWCEGIIFCSLPTANLVHEQLGVDRQYLHPLPLLTPTTLPSKNKAVTVTLLDANHCPGAIMFLFEIGKRVILHVGDFRWNYAIMSRQAPLQAFCRIPWTGRRDDTKRRIDELYLDTTYCNPQYALPTQDECIAAAVQVASEEMQQVRATKNRLLLLFGAYTIGKENVFFSVAQHLRMKIYVDRRRFKILSALGLPEEKISLLTTNPRETIIWVVPLGHISFKKMPTYQKRESDRVIGFRPTGWSMQQKKTNTNTVVGTMSRGNLVVHSIPYSEHSSFPELVECLECLNPQLIVPTVAAYKSQEQIDLLLTHWKKETNCPNS